MQRVLAPHEAAHRGHGGRRGNGNDGESNSYPQYTRFSAFVQPLKRLARRPMLRAALALSTAGLRLGGLLHYAGARLALGLALAGDWLAGVSLRWECEL